MHFFPTPNASSFVDSLADFALIAFGVLVLAALLFYVVRFAWLSTPAGRGFVIFTWTLLIVLGQNVLARLAGTEYPARDLVRLIIYLAGVAGAAFILGTFIWYDLRDAHRARVLAQLEQPPVDVEA